MNKNELGIKIKCENCLHWNDGCDFKPSHKRQSGVCLRSVYFAPSNNAMESRILELQAERDKFKAPVEKVANDDKETFSARFCRTPEEYALSALEFVCSEADRLEAENEKWRDAFGGRTPEEAKRDFDNIIQDLIDCKAGKRKEAIEIVANHISQTGKMVDIRKLVKPLVWVDTNNKTRSDCRLGNLWICVYAAQWTPDPNLDSWFIGHSDSSEQCIDSLSHIDNDARNLEEAKQFAQDWLVSLVANACGLESEVRNER